MNNETCFKYSNSRTTFDITVYPIDLMCPLSHKEFTRPVVASDGVTYEYAAIVDYINSCIATTPDNRSIQSPISEHLFFIDTPFVPEQFLRANKIIENILGVKGQSQNCSTSNFLDSLSGKLYDYAVILSNKQTVDLNHIINSKNYHNLNLDNYYENKLVNKIIRRSINSLSITSLVHNPILLDAIECAKSDNIEAIIEIDRQHQPLDIFRSNFDLNNLKLCYILASLGAKRSLLYMLHKKIDVIAQRPDGVNSIFYAINTNDDLIINILRSQYVDLNSKTSPGGYTALHIAAMKGFDNSIQALLRCGASFMSESDDGLTPLFSSTTNHLHTTLLLLKSGMNPLAVDANKNGLYHYLAKSLDTSTVYLQQILNICRTSVVLINNDGITPLHTCVSHNNTTFMLMFLNLLKPDLQLQDLVINKQDRQGLSALMLAVLGNNLNMTRILLNEGANPNLLTRHQYLAIDLAIQNSSYEIIQLLLENGSTIFNKSTVGLTPLDNAIIKERSDIVSMFLSNDVICSKTLSNPLHLITISKSSESKLKNCITMIPPRKLVSFVMQKNKLGFTPADYANSHNNRSLIMYIRDILARAQVKQVKYNVALNKTV